MFIFTLLAVLSFVYFILLLFWLGWIPYLWLLPLFSMLNGGMLPICRSLSRKFRSRDQRGLALPVFGLITYLLFLGSMTVTGLLVVTSFHYRVAPGLDYLVVVGTDLGDHGIPKLLSERLDQAAEYLRENPGTKLVLSGGKGRWDGSTQASVMYFQMLKRGISGERMVMEYRSRSLREKVGYSLETLRSDFPSAVLLLPDGSELSVDIESSPEAFPYRSEENVVEDEDRPVTVGFLGDDVSIFRIRHIAGQYGYDNISVSGNGAGPFTKPFCIFRENCAILKDALLYG